MLQDDKAWLDYRRRFSEVYDDSNYTSPLQSFVMRASHRLVEKSYGPEQYFSRVIEIGAGTGEHISFVRHAFDKYILTDLDHATLDVANKKLATVHPERVSFAVQQGASLDYPDQSFDRLIATHVLEHINEPHLAVKEWARVLCSGGLLSILIPTDPGIAWRLGRHFGPRSNAIAQGIAYDYVMAREHVNACTNLLAILRHYFPDAQEAWWPFPIPSVDLNLFFSFNARIIR